MRFYLEPGGLRLLPASTPGRVLLSQIGDDDVQRLLLRINAEELSTPRLRFSDLKPALDTIRCQGFAYTREIGTAGLSTMAMPLTAAGQGPALAIAVAGPSALVAAEAGTILRTMRDLIEAHAPGVLPPIDLDAPPRET